MSDIYEGYAHISNLNPTSTLFCLTCGALVVDVNKHSLWRKSF